MIDFMVLGPPRSGTAWAANWLTTDGSLCFHGLSRTLHHSQWDTLDDERLLGVADPTVIFFPEWLNKHPARKVVLHRDRAEVEASLGVTGLDLDPWINRIDGLHVHWRMLFERPRSIYEHLLQREFDAKRHRVLLDLQVNSMAIRTKPDPAVYRRLAEEIRHAG